MLTTPKPGWSGAPVLAPLAAAVTGPAALDLDVNGAALGEGRWGAAQRLSSFAYMTVGTGIGVGLVDGGRAVNGAVHPEAGHMRIRRRPGDGFEGICEFHGDCLAGLASGPAIEARTGERGASLGDGHPVWDEVVDHLAEACANLFLTTACERIVIGGGVSVDRPSLISRVGQATLADSHGSSTSIRWCGTRPRSAAVGLAVPTSMPRYRAIESIETTSAPSRSASPRAS